MTTRRSFLAALPVFALAAHKQNEIRLEYAGGKWPGQIRYAVMGLTPYQEAHLRRIAEQERYLRGTQWK